MRSSSRSAERVAVRRAIHQLLDVPKVFDDPWAVAIANVVSADELQRSQEAESVFSRALRAFLAVRSRYAEDQLALAAGRGVSQYVVLGAGLDTFAYRNPFRGLGLRVFEVDHPATQEWKLAMLREASIAITKDVTFVPVDFESQALRDGLLASDFDCDRPAFFPGWASRLIFRERRSTPQSNS